MHKPDQFITVVSGVPRSGTSMMMRMLDAGGMQTVTDNVRKSDINNPYGYYEFEPVKQLSKNTDWLTDAYGRAVKIIYLLLYHLPPDHRYKVIFMTRHLDEVIASQDAMLEGLQQKRGTPNNARFADTIRTQLEKLDQWMEAQPNFHTLYLKYDEVLRDPQRAVHEIDRFLGCGLDIEAMVEVIDPALHRQRHAGPS